MPALSMLVTLTSGNAQSAATSSVVLRARFTLQPRLITEPDIQPPAIEPTSASR